MENLHFFPVDKFLIPFVEFVNENFNSEGNSFVIIGSSKNIDFSNFKNVDKVNNFKKFINLLFQMNHSNKIFLHSLPSRVLLLLCLQPWLLSKTYWIIWGADLYFYKNKRPNIINLLKELMRKRVIKNLQGLITQVKGDYYLAKKWYKTNGSYYYSFAYPSNLFKGYNLSNASKSDKIYIQIGNSADPSNNHLEIIEKLSKYREKEIEIICPLSYGDINYREKVINAGKNIFGDKFIPLLDFMPFEEYIKVLEKTDIAIFNHDRQQALGNIITLIGLGKKVYIRNEITTWQFTRDHELKVFNSNGNFKNLFEKMNTKEKQKNIENVRKNFSERRLIYTWENIFKD